MPQAQASVIAIDARRGVFAMRIDQDRYAVYSQYSGPDIAIGDILRGTVEDRGVVTFKHPVGPLQALNATGAISRDEALRMVNRPR